jgi:predicted nucleic acid-binding protein
MRTRLLLDSPILTMLCHPTRYQDVRRWFLQLVSQAPPKHEFFVSVISLYEVRRGLASQGASQSIEQFDKLVKNMKCLVLDAKSADRAATLQAKHLNNSPSISDADWLIASQAAEVGATLVTSDKHLMRLCNTLSIAANDWVGINVEDSNPA